MSIARSFIGAPHVSFALIILFPYRNCDAVERSKKINTTPWNAYDFVWYKVQSKAQVKWIWCAGLLAHGTDLKSTLNQSIFIVVTAIAHQKSQLEFYQSWHFFQWLRLAYGKMRLDPANSDTMRCGSQYFQMMKKGNKTNWHPLSFTVGPIGHCIRSLADANGVDAITILLFGSIVWMYRFSSVFPCMIGFSLSFPLQCRLAHMFCYVTHHFARWPPHSC